VVSYTGALDQATSYLYDQAGQQVNTDGPAATSPRTTT
jgi:hypothetical protein